jgi:hypothetical protein
MPIPVRKQKGESGFPNIYYRTVDGQLMPALIISAAALATPAAPTVNNVGTGGAAAYSYRVVARSGAGKTLASAAGTTATGNATLDATNYNRVTWVAVPGATAYDIYGRSGTELYLGTVYVTAPGGSTKIGGGVINVNALGNGFEDKGTVTPAGAQPASADGFRYGARVPGLRQGPSGAANSLLTDTGVALSRFQSGMLVAGR